ncbi:hypothetical protein ER308_00870 [Egibacter rhizosphaerae]|uniref:Cell envelope-related transcriptional attenuator domain-containing protein n=1 Tax=Egibacter rhizosphaerae TaxID=1670831 RepID=A0A411YAL3_9ACTN|nr:LCP family protein [Egibacter rhizosphaerae]QBI18263.1 hypothetical protein ER308_00870 [Egibacter rhizosphaerae]
MGRKRRRVLIGVSVAVGVFVLGASAAAAALVWRFDQGIERRDVDFSEQASQGEEAAEEDPGEPDDRDSDEDRDGTQDTAEDDVELPDPVDEVVTVLVAASDDRSVLTEEEQAELGTGGDRNSERTETNMLVRLDPDGPRADILSLPRDSYVELCDGSLGRLNTAYGIGERSDVGGPTCLVQTISNWTGITPDHYAKIDFRGFVDLVDAVGGVEMWMEAPIQDEDANLDVEAGCQVFNGGEALAFSRARSIDNDFGRIARQQRLLVELRDEVVSGQTAVSPRRLLDLTDAAASSLEVDEDLTLNRMRQLAVAGLDVPSEDIHTATMPGEIADEPPYVTHVDPVDVAELSAAFVDGALGDVAEDTTDADEDDSDSHPGPSSSGGDGTAEEAGGTDTGPAGDDTGPAGDDTGPAGDDTGPAGDDDGVTDDDRQAVEEDPGATEGSQGIGGEDGSHEDTGTMEDPVDDPDVDGPLGGADGNYIGADRGPGC